MTFYELQEAIINVVAYNWHTEQRDYTECLDPSNEYSSSPEGHIFLSLRSLAEFVGYRPESSDEQIRNVICQARDLDPENPHLIVPWENVYQRDWSYLNALRVIAAKMWSGADS